MTDTQTTHSFLYTIQYLHIDDIPAMLTLQDKAADGLAVMRSADDLSRHFAAGQTALGIYSEGELIAQTLLAKDFNNSATLIGGVLTAPHHRGKGLMSKLITTSLDLTAAEGCPSAEARVRPHNEASYRSFLKHGFHVAATGTSPDAPDEQIYIMRKKLGVPETLAVPPAASAASASMAPAVSA